MNAINVSVKKRKEKKKEAIKMLKMLKIDAVAVVDCIIRVLNYGYILLRECLGNLLTFVEECYHCSFIQRES